MSNRYKQIIKREHCRPCEKRHGQCSIYSIRKKGCAVKRGECFEAVQHKKERNYERKNSERTLRNGVCAQYGGFDGAEPFDGGF